NPASVGPAAGTTTIIPDVSGTGLTNFDITLVDGSFTINKASSVTAVSCPAGVTYNGSAQTPCTATVTGAGGLSQTLTPTYTDNVNVGTATASASFAGDANHTSSSDSKTFQINKAGVTYNGAAQTPCTSTVTGAGGLSQTLTVDYTNNINVGTATASASFAGDANHTSSSDSKTFQINKAAVTATAGGGSAAYDGLTKSPSACAVSGTYTGDLTCANNPASVGPGASTTTITPVVSGTGLSNFDITLVNGSFTIGAASSVTTVSCPAGVAYNGSA